MADILDRLSRALFLVGLSLSVLGGAASGQEIRVTLLGTGNPPPVMDRFGPSILVEAGDKKFLFDAGRGAIQRMTQNQDRMADN
jgi:ribonuclease Z